MYVHPVCAVSTEARRGTALGAHGLEDKSMSLLELAGHKEKVRSDCLNVSVALAEDSLVCTGLTTEPRN